MPKDVDLAWPLEFRFVHSRRVRLLRTVRDAVELLSALSESEKRSLHWSATAGAVSRALGVRHDKAVHIATEMVENALAVEGWLLNAQAPQLAHA